MENYFEYIQDYLDGILPTEERGRFEQELERNEVLRLETAQQRMLRAVIEKQLAATAMIPALQATLEEVGNRHFRKRAGRKRYITLRWLAPMAVAASLLLVFNFLGWFATDYEALPDMPAAVMRGSDGEDALVLAAEAYNAENYTRSIELLQTLMAADPTAARYPYYLGLSYIGSEDYPRAIAQLQAVADGKSVFADDARYFLAVALWRSGKVEEATSHAARVTDKSAFHKKAEKLSRKLTN